MALVISACGSSSHSTASPAGAVPADVPLYVQVAVPDSDKLGEYKQLVTRFGGAGAWSQLSNSFTKQLTSNKVNWNKDVAPWVGTHIGIAFTGLQAFTSTGTGAGTNSDQGLVLVLPTNDMQAAVAFAKRQLDPGESYVRDGKFLLLGDPAALTKFKSGATTKLGSSASYEAMQGSLAGDDAALYANVHALATEIASASQSATSVPQLNGAQHQLQQQLAKIPADASVGVGLGIAQKTVSLDVIPHNLPSSATGASGGAGDVSGLPADSVLAAALDLTLDKNSSLLKQFRNGLHMSAGAQLGSAGGALTAQAGQQADSLLNSLAPALGPLQFAFGGSTLLNLHAGLEMSSPDPSAASALMSSLFSAAQSGNTLGVTGSAQDFTINLGLFKVHVSNSAGKILALLGYQDAAQLLSPASALSSNSVFKSAKQQLPSGAKVPLYLSFKSLRALLSSLPSSGSDGLSPQDRKELRQLSYLIVGSAPQHIRVVLGLT